MLHIQELRKTYGEFEALKGITLDATDGQVFGLLGPNGAGKTTLLRILATLLEPSGGTATVAGHDIRREPEAVRRSIGVVNGGMGLYDRLTGREILRYFAGFYDLPSRRVEQRIEELDTLLGLGSTLDRRVGEFSTGMKQKIVIARAVLHDPAVLFLDEAATGLDILARRALLDFVLAYRRPGRLVVYSTHVMAEVEEVCDSVAIVNQGELLTVGTVSSILAQTGQRSLERAFFDLVHERAVVTA